ncbi:MAG: hypothetical protein CM1200mP13_14120 [Candidatus Pelagibacterales bacterium]|nr:MAG: hypothetical protein CM1200mP13_14120 [Pelagibacterales bacterium]
MKGLFPTELKKEIGNKIGRIGNEFGTVTNRKRRCGWFDAVLVKQSCIISGTKGIALTKIDVLDKILKIYIFVLLINLMEKKLIICQLTYRVNSK